MCSQQVPHDQFNDADSRLAILSRPLTGTGDEVCAEHLRRNSTDETHVVGFAVTESPASLISLWRHYVGTEITPESMTLILATPTDSERHETFTTDAGTTVDVYWTHPADFTGIMIAFEKTLRKHADEDLLVCLRGLSSLLMYGEPNQVYRLLQSCLDYLQVEGATIHAHLTNDEQAEQFLDLFGSVVTAE